jgi:N-acetylglucosaminyldiphosphoundecaprenol N-acetyl-beta-D-mannosaminyltransferase
VWGTGEQIDTAGKSLTWQGAMLEGNLAGKRGGERRYILGVGINQVSVAQAVEIIDSWVQSRTQKYVCVTGVHGVMESQRDRNLMKIHNGSGLTVPDGVPLVWISKMRGSNDVTRVYGPDLMLAVCGLGESKGYRHFFYGGKEGVPKELAERLEQRFPEIDVVGQYSPPFRPLTQAEDETVIKAINSANPDIVWVGLSTPKQERWMADHRACLEAPVLVGVGAAFDFLSGRLRQAPRWMMNAGLEWLFRLMMEPRRLWKRYTINNVLFLYYLLLEAIGVRRRN